MLQSVEVKNLTHEMKLAPQPFENIFNGIKTAEYRLFDRKRREIRVGDKIVFTNLESGERLSVAVTEISVYQSFLELFTARGSKECGCGSMTAQQLAEAMREYYSEDQENEHGVVAIGIRLIGPELKIIGRIKNDFPTKFGLPRQAGLVEEITGYVDLLPEYSVKEALRGLEGYSHMWILWGFSHAERDEWSPTVRPPRLGGNTKMGVFATRAPYRPNPIGLSSVKIEKTDTKRCRIYFNGGDMCNGTPVYDIKPYLGFTDSHTDSIDGFAGEKKDYEVEVIVPDNLKSKIPSQKLQGLIGALKDDPRPAYKREESKEYGFAYGGMEIKFIGEEGRITVTDILTE